MANCDESKNWIQTSSHSNCGIPLTPWLVASDDVAGFRCAWTSRGWYIDGKAWSTRIVFHSDKFDACYLAWRWWCSTGCGSPDDKDCKALDDKEVVRIRTRGWITTRSDTDGVCIPHWSWVDCGWASQTDSSGEEMHSMGCFRSLEGS